MLENQLQTYLLSDQKEYKKPELDTAIGGLPRFRFASWPTPLEKGPLLPSGKRLWLKRDDVTGIGLGGNKLRKLEFLLGRAAYLDCDVVITSGATQSNHCRLVAACGAMLGFEVHVVLASNQKDNLTDNDLDSTGNLLLMEIFGATIHKVSGDIDEAKIPG